MTRLDRATLCDWFAAHGAALLLFARQCLPGGDRGDAEDVLQSLFVRLLAKTESPGELSLPPSPAAWLHQCVRNACLDAQRDRQRRIRRERHIAAAAAGWFESRHDDLIDAAVAQQLLETLEPIDRQILVLRIWSGLTLAETAAIAGLPLSSVHERYGRALKQLRQAMEQRSVAHAANRK